MHPQTHTHTHTYTCTYLGPLQLNHDSVSQWVRKGVVITLLVAIFIRKWNSDEDIYKYLRL